MASGVPKYLRQEIRGVMLLDPGGKSGGGPGSSSNSSGSSAANSTTTASQSSAASAVASAGVKVPKESTAASAKSNPSQSSSAAQSSSATTAGGLTGAQQLVANRLSKLPSQLQQQHFKNLWKHYLYELQQKAPTPKRVMCRYNITSRPAHYGREFHGIMARNEAEQLLLEEDGEDGRYLVRESSRSKGQMTLSLRFNGTTKNFRLYHDHGQHYVNELKRFDTLHDLVADGLIALYLELHAADYIANLTSQCRYEESPYMTLHRAKLGPPRRLQPAPSSSSSNVNKVPSPRPQSGGQSEPSVKSKAANRRSMLADGGGGIRLITSHAELEAPDEDIYVTPCGSVGGASLAGATGTTGVNIQAYEKAHSFRTHTFIGNPWCDYCGNFIWGLIGQGVRCDDCGFGAHRKCSELVPNDCCPDLRHIRRIFGIDLTTFVKASNALRPFLVDLLVGEVERRGMTVEGIYRACGSADEIETLKNRFEAQWEQADSYLRSVEDIHVITGLLKLYLRLLPIPLITFDAYPDYIEALKKSSQEQTMSALREATGKLPPAHYQTLKFLVTHLNRVSVHEHRNLMSAKNLSLIFGQTLLYTPNIPMMFQLNCWELESQAIEALIVHHNKIFIK